MKSRISVIAATLLSCLVVPLAGRAEVAIPVVTYPQNGVDGVTIYANAPVSVDETAELDGNHFVVFSLTAGSNNGSGFGFSISNGENGIDSSEGGANTDVPNTVPVNAAIEAVNGVGQRLQNGNAIRFSAWFQQDPNDPITKEPSVEPVLKLELWKEYGSGNGDYTSGRKALASYGDRMWDTDINAPDPFWDGYGQSQASRIDINNDGDIANGDSLTASLPPATSGFEWVLVESTLIIDDTPDDQPGYNWGIGGDNFDVTAIEEVRASMYVGHWTTADLSDGGSFWMDNLMLEVFADEATMLATPNPNPMPEPAATGLAGDFSGDGAVDGADLSLLLGNWGSSLPPIPSGWNGTPPTEPLVDGDDLSALLGTWGQGVGTGLFAAQVPEPSTVCLGLLAIVGGLLSARRSNN